MKPRPLRALIVANLVRQTRDRVGLFFMVVMPFVTIVFVGMALGGGAADEQIPVAVVAAPGDKVADAVVAELSADPDLLVSRVDTEAELRDGVRRGTLAAGLVIPRGATEFDLVMTQTSGSGMAARSAVDVAVGKVSAVQEATRAAESAGASPEEAAGYVRDAQTETREVAVSVSGDEAGETPTGFAYTAPANLLLFTFVNSMAVAAALVESRRIGMIRRSLAAPVRQSQILMGEAVSRFLVAIAQSLLIIVVSALVFAVDWGDWLTVTAVTALFCLTATGAAMLVGALVKSPQQAPAIGPPVGIVLGMLGGCLWPREVAGEPLTTIGYFFPHSWAMDALLAATKPGAGITSVLLELAVLAGMAAVVLAVAVTVFRRRAILVR
ncbi:ABC transporter permease [Actinophytocola sp. NPDC049390]|uniref:ABC transporter permease n=1 Tax=Actinophytocola sp. NPDC049390 TaxID=3363894 RepID=UPI00379AB339